MNKIKIINCFSNNQNNGSIEMQIAILTNRIKYLHKHFTIHKKDKHSRIGLLNIITKRRKLLNYLKNKNLLSYNTIITKLNLRH